MTDTTPADELPPPDLCVGGIIPNAYSRGLVAELIRQARAASVPAQEPVGEWRMKNGEPMHVLWRARYKPQLGDKLYATPPADSAKADNIDQEN